MSGHYQIREFARLAGVTVKALHHYDRLGLLRPRRTEAGYRVYCNRDLETLEQIIALKFLGLPLKEIGAILKRPALQLPDTLRLQREALEDRRDLLGRAIRAIRSAEESLASGKPADLALLKNIIEVIDMQEDVAVMKKYYSEESWERHRRYYEQGPAPEWQQFYRDGQALLGTDPAGEQAQALVRRWLDLSQRAHAGDPEVPTDSPAAWMDRAHWPAAIKQRAAEFHMEDVQMFVRAAAIAANRHAFSDKAWAKIQELHKQPPEGHSSQWQARVDLFRDLEAALGEDPAGANAQALVARWRAQLEINSGGNPEIKAALLAGWSRRRHWPESHRWQVERLHMMSFERFERAADFLDRAIAASEARQEENMNRTTWKTALLEEFEEEMAATRRILERVPDDQFAWKPTEKSMTLGRLANHVAAIPVGASVAITKKGAPPAQAATKTELLEFFDQRIQSARQAFASLTDEQLAGEILVVPTIKKPLWAALRGRGFMNHLIHHRGQLSVYLRLLNVPVPGMYGPSADEKP